MDKTFLFEKIFILTLNDNFRGNIINIINLSLGNKSE